MTKFHSQSFLCGDMSRRKKKAKKRHPNKGPVFMQMPKLFRDDITEEQRIEAIRVLAEKFAEKRDAAFLEIRDFVMKFNPLHALAVMAAKGLITTPGTGGRMTLKDAMERITQDHVEFLQAMCLTVGLDAVSRKPAGSPELQGLWDALIELGRGYDLSRLKPLDLNKPEDAIVRIQERIRSHTRGIRNWGYYHQVNRIGRGLLEPLDTTWLQRLGFSGSSLVTVLDNLIRNNESKLNEHRQRFMPAIMRKSLAEMVQAYSEAMPEADCSDLLDYFSRNNLTLDQARMVLLSHSDLELSDCFIHDAVSVSNRTGVDVREVTAIFHAIGMAPGALAGRDAQMFLLDNPVWTSPLVLLDETTVFACIPQAAFSFFFEIVANLVRPDADLTAAWQARRATFLEEDVARLLHQALPGSTVHRNLEWRTVDNSTNGETDLLVLIDSLLLIVEAKSGAISASSKRGAPVRLKSEVKELLEAPALQSQRAAAAFADHISGRAQLHLSEHVDFSKVKHVIRLSVTLEDFWTFQSDLGELQRIGLVSQEVAPVPTIGLTDLDALCEVLDRPSLLLHYLHRRSQLEGRFSHDSDELNLLGGYMMNGLLFGDMETNGSRLVFHRMSDDVDRYLTAISEGITLRKPARQISEWWKLILDRIETRKLPRWVETAIAVLDIDHDGQKRIEKNLKKLIKKHQHQITDPYLNAIFFLPGGIAYAAVVVLVLNDKNYSERADKSGAVAEKVFEDPRPQICVVIGFNSDRLLQPYNFMRVIDRSEFLADTEEPTATTC
jgi:hypothetical protein